MKKRLRFLMPHVPLKVLRGEQNQEDVRDKYYERFQAPGTTTEDAEDDKDIDDDYRTSSLSNDDVTTDIGEVSEEGMARCLGGHTSSVDNVVQFDNEIQNHQNKNTQEYDTTRSVNHETAEVEAAVQVHQYPSKDDSENNSLSNDDIVPLLTEIH